jgi:uncharacterized protein with PQ loop repeat
MEANLILAPLGIILSVVNNLTPTLAIFSRMKSDTVHQVPLTYLKLNHICQLFWLIYSLLIPSPVLIFCNLITTVASGFNLFLYVFSTKALLSFVPKYLVVFSTLNTLAFFYAASQEIGVVCSVLSIITAVASAEPLRSAVKTQEYSHVDVPMAFSGMICAAVWSLLGLANADMNIIVSNLFGVAVGLILILTHSYLRFTHKTSHNFV